jgi:hypothetical protein
MMKKRFILWIIAFVIIGMISCKSDSSKKKKILTERVQYDVFIKSPDPDSPWWVDNIEGLKRESLIKTIINKVYSGEIKAYEYMFKRPYTKEEVKALENYTDTLAFQRAYPPYDYYDTVVVHQLDIQKIVKIKFLEEWYFDEKHNIFEKKVVGLAPVKENYGKDGELRGYTPMFWIFFDKKYPDKLK